MSRARHLGHIYLWIVGIYIHRYGIHVLWEDSIDLIDLQVFGQLILSSIQ